MELWDGYTSDYEKIDGVVLVRDDSAGIPVGIYHLVCDILVRHKDGTYLLMKRDSRKTHGGMWEASAGGAALQGEDPIACATRELREETGILGKEFQEIGRDRNEVAHSIFVLYLCETEQDKDSVTLQEGETVDYKWVTFEEMIAMPETELLCKRIKKCIPGWAAPV